jgi:putative addiction module component (TIGR02574 family)
MGQNNISELLKLGTLECLAIDEQLWDSVVSEREQVPASKHEIDYINQRLDEHLKNPSETVPWPQIKKELGL